MTFFFFLFVCLFVNFFTGSYYMKYLGWSFEKVLDYDNNFIPPHRDILFTCRNALQWYCYFLHYVEGKPLHCELPSNHVLKHERFVRRIPKLNYWNVKSHIIHQILFNIISVVDYLTFTQCNFIWKSSSK